MTKKEQRPLSTAPSWLKIQIENSQVEDTSVRKQRQSSSSTKIFNIIYVILKYDIFYYERNNMKYFDGINKMISI